MRIKSGIILLGTTLLLCACSAEHRPDQTQAGVVQNGAETQSEVETDTSVGADTRAEPSASFASSVESNGASGKNILIAYFTRLDNTDASLEEILQGGGPYGPIGTSLEDADMDAITSASIQVIDGEIQGSTEAVARMIQEYTGGDLFSVQTVQDYPVDYDTLIEQGGEERNQGIRPELEKRVEHMQDYDTIFLGFPNWWYDMPMGMYSFLENHDFSGKRVIPFVTSASSGFSDTIRTLQEMLPDAEIEKEGLAIQMADVAGANAQVKEWVNGLKLRSGE